MARVLALVEGQTEQSFVKELLAHELAPHNIFLTASLLGKPGRRHGGIRRWHSVRRDVIAALKQDRERFCTTMFDYYAMPSDWPGRSPTPHSSSSAVASTVERALADDIRHELGLGFDQRRFVPYVQMHEFEALLFSDPAAFASVMLDHSSAAETLLEIAASFDTPEDIDDSPMLAPSKRILAIAPGYEKVVHGLVAARRVGLPRMRAVCPHFNDWLTRLERLEPAGETTSLP